MGDKQDICSNTFNNTDFFKFHNSRLIINWNAQPQIAVFAYMCALEKRNRLLYKITAGEYSELLK